MADLLDDAEENQGQLMELDEEGELYYVEEPEEPDDEELSVCEPIAEEIEEPDLVSEPDNDLRPQQNRASSGRYNPESGRSYHQAVACNNIVAQVESSDDALIY